MNRPQFTKLEKVLAVIAVVSSMTALGLAYVFLHFIAKFW